MPDKLFVCPDSCHFVDEVTSSLVHELMLHAEKIGENFMFHFLAFC